MNFVVPLCIGFTSLKVAEPIRRDSYSYPPHPQELWCSFDRPQKNERLSRPWSHLMVFNLRPLAAKNAGISWCGKRTDSLPFRTIHLKLCGNYALSQIFHTTKLREITVIYELAGLVIHKTNISWKGPTIKIP